MSSLAVYPQNCPLEHFSGVFTATIDQTTTTSGHMDDPELTYFKLTEYDPFLNTCLESIRNFLTINNKFFSMSSQDHKLIYHLGRLLYIAFKQRDTL